VTASEARAHPSPQEIRARIESLPVSREQPGSADAAVLILVRFGDEGPEVLAEQRAERPDDPWSGHVGLPGGRRDPEDPSLDVTALRELHEEVAIPGARLETGPRLFDVRRARPSGLSVAVFAALFAGPREAARGADPEEVATVFWLPLRALDQWERHPRSTMFGEMLVDATVFDGHVVWGFTLRVLRDFVAWLTGPDGPAPDAGPRARRASSQAL
jgi:8-oxo-dGTP pyrophosphatase MutT (NUDIX family)